MFNELKDEYFSKIYDELQKENTRLMNEIRNQTLTKGKEKELHRRISILNSIMMSLLKYKSIKIEE